MAKYYAHVVDGRVVEVIAPFLVETDVFNPGEVDPVTQEVGPPVLVWAAGYEVPIGERFPAAFVAELVELPAAGDIAEGWSYDGTTFAAPVPVVPSPAELLANAQASQRYYKSIADNARGPLQDAVDLGEATPAEEALLLKWKQYSVALSRVPQQAGYPATIIWPVVPA